VKRWQQIGLMGGLALPITVAALVDWRMMSRAITYPTAPIMAVDWYQPLTPVPGNWRQPLPEADPATAPVSAEALAAVSAYAARHNSTGLIVLHRGQIIWEEYWQGYGPDSRFNAMSMSKTVVALLLGIAIAEGHIESVADPVARYLPEWGQDDRAAITLADLLYMQSGLRNEDRTDSPFSDLVQMYVGSRVNQTALRVPSQRSPAEVYEYNNVNTQILSLVLERATGEAYPAYLSSRLWQPLGATDAAIWLDRPGGDAKTFCCLFATARDWARVGQLWLDQGRVGARAVVPPDWIAAMAAPSPLEATYGSHIWIKARTADYPNVDTAATTAFVDADTVYLDGRGLQRVYVMPQRQLVVVRMGEDTDQWDDAVIPNTLLGP
jgi:CubicO group peptidase (beta-lactamase class C family)